MALNPNRTITTNGVPVNGIQHMKNMPIDVYTANVTLDDDNSDVVCDTDTVGAFTVSLPAGTTGVWYRISNAGIGSNLVTISPNGAELLLGYNVDFLLSSGETLLIKYSTKGWN